MSATNLTWDDVAAGAKAFAKRAEWRVAPLYDSDDLIQEFQIVFWKLGAREFESNDHLRAYFVEACRNRVHDLCRPQRMRVSALSLDRFLEDSQDHSALLPVVSPRETYPTDTARQILRPMAPKDRRRCSHIEKRFARTVFAIDTGLDLNQNDIKKSMFPTQERLNEAVGQILAAY